jgi:hypothetical protein
MNLIRAKIDRLFESDTPLDQVRSARPGMIPIRVELEDGTSYNTVVNAQVSDEDIRRYFVGQTLDQGPPDGPERLVKVKNVVINRVGGGALDRDEYPES